MSCFIVQFHTILFGTLIIYIPTWHNPNLSPTFDFDVFCRCCLGFPLWQTAANESTKPTKQWLHFLKLLAGPPKSFWNANNLHHNLKQSESLSNVRFWRYPLDLSTLGHQKFVLDTTVVRYLPNQIPGARGRFFLWRKWNFPLVDAVLDDELTCRMPSEPCRHR